MFCLRRLGITAHLLPTTMLGRHPGWGAPGGGPVPVETLADMWTGILAQNITFDAVMTGYMASPEHALFASSIIKTLRKANPEIFILVDPVMGDNGRLYVSKDTANAIMSDLIPLANIITPNLWELGYITQSGPVSLNNIVSTLSSIPADTLVTSVSVLGQIGALLKSGNETGLVRHEKFETVPHGGGDALAAAYLAHVLNGADPGEALSKSTSAIFEMMTTAVNEHLLELPLIRRQDALVNAAPLDVEKMPDERPRRD